MRRTILFLLLLAVPALAGLDAARAESKKSKNLERCIRAAIGDTASKKGLRVFGHEFHCYTAKRRTSRSETLYSGRLSHALRFRKDDQVHYRIRVARVDGRRCVASVDVDINRGGFAPIPGSIAGLFGKHGFENDWREAAKDWDGNWEETANLVIGGIASHYGPACGGRR